MNKVDSHVEWIGSIPSDWEIVRFKDIYTSKKEIVGENVNDFERLSLTLKGVLKRSKEDNDGLQPKDFYTYQILRTNDMVFKMIDLQNISTSRVGLSPFDGLVSPAYLRFEPKNKPNKFMYYYFMSMYYNLVFNHIAGDGVRSALNATDLGNIKCPYPLYDVQEKIVSILDEKIQKIDALIANQEEQVKKLKEYKQSFITKTLINGINVQKMKYSGIEWIGDIPEHWQLIKIKYVANISRGLFNHRPRNDERLFNGDYPFIQTGDVARSNKYIKNYSQTLNEEGIKASKCFKKGTLTMTIAANVGDVSILDFDAYFPDSVVGITPLYDNRSLYFYYLFLSMKNEFIRASISNTQLNLNVERIKEIIIPYTSDVNEQDDIIDFLESKCYKFDMLIGLKIEKINKLQEYKKSLIYEYVTGKKSVYAE